MERMDKLEISADAAHCGAPCAGSGAITRSSEGKDGIGATTGTGVCHSDTLGGLRAVLQLRGAASQLLRRAMAGHAPPRGDQWAPLQTA